MSLILSRADCEGGSLGLVYTVKNIQGLPHCLTPVGCYQVDDNWLHDHPHRWETDSEEDSAVSEEGDEGEPSEEEVIKCDICKEHEWAGSYDGSNGFYLVGSQHTCVRCFNAYQRQFGNVPSVHVNSEAVPPYAEGLRARVDPPVYDEKVEGS